MSISIILAAGAGTRMMSEKAKSLHNVCGKPILSYVLDASKSSGIEKNILIIGHGGEQIQEEFKDEDVIFEKQPIGEDAPYGTGYAVYQGVNHIEDDSTVLILYGDTPLITEKTLRELIDFHEKEDYMGTVLTAIVENPKGYGRILRNEHGDIEKIVEEKDATQEEKKIKEINSGIYCFNGKLLKKSLEKIDNHNEQGEFYITDVIEILSKEKHKVGAHTMANSEEIYGVNSKEQLAFCEKIMRKRINKYHMESGVTIINPENTYIESDVSIGSDTTIYPNVLIQGNTRIGNNCIIRPGTRIYNSVLYDSIEIESSLIEDSKIKSKTTIGPNAHIRPDSIIGENVHIGNFVEVKNASIGDDTKAGHLSYIGDAEVGKNVNIGCGVVFANYDGINKHKTIVEDDSFIGSSSTLVSPITIKKGAYIAAGSTIVEDVMEDDLAIARGRQVTKKDWAKNNQK